MRYINRFLLLANRLQDLLDATRHVDWLGPLALRLYLVPVFWVSGMEKVIGFSNIVEWFGNPEWGLGLPAPLLMAFLATSAEVVGAIFLLFGFAVRWISLPLMITMIVAMLTVHWQHGWQVIASSKAPFASEHLGFLQLENASGAGERLDKAKELLREHGHYDWLTEQGNFVVLNNGVEWAVTYFIMLLVLFFIGGGRFVSLDYWIARRFRQTKR